MLEAVTDVLKSLDYRNFSAQPGSVVATCLLTSARVECPRLLKSSFFIPPTPTPNKYVLYSVTEMCVFLLLYQATVLADKRKPRVCPVKHSAMPQIKDSIPTSE